MNNKLMELLSIGLRREETASKPLLMLRVFKTIGLALALGVSMSACSKTISWEEEVLLHDGQIIVAERFYNMGGYPTLESQERAALDVTVTFSPPGTNKKIVWKTDYDQAKPEPNSLNLIRLDVVNGVPYIAAYPAGCIAYNKWGRPNPPQVLFKYANEQWQRIALAEFPAALINTNANVIVGKPAAVLLKSFYTVAGVNAENHGIDDGPYKTILREAVKNGLGVTSCPDYNSQQYRSFKAPLPMKPANEKQ